MTLPALSPHRRGHLSILAKLILAFVVPTALLFSLFAMLAYRVQRRELEGELGRRLQAIASSSAARIRGQYLVDLQAGEEGDLRYAGAMRRLQQDLEATDVARISVFDAEFRTRADTSGAPIGSRQFQAELDRAELRRLFLSGEPVASLLFEGRDGRLYKAAYAPVSASDEDPTTVLALGVDAPADFFERLADLRRTLLVYGVALALLVAIIAVVVAARITRPVRLLVEAAERIGAGDLVSSVARSSRDEIGLLAATMERMRGELYARDERMQRMVAGIAHEVRNPLGGIELFTGILRDELGADDPRRSHVARIDRELDYLKNVVESFLDFARRPEPDLEKIMLDAVAAGCIELCQVDAEKAGVELSCERVPSPCRGDAAQLKRAILNLLGNAIQAAGRGGLVHLEVWSRASSVGVAIENTGTAIPEALQTRIFEPFFTTREKGTGLGLAFAREIVHAHGGTIAVASAGKRTTFTIELPLAGGAPE